MTEFQVRRMNLFLILFFMTSKILCQDCPTSAIDFNSQQAIDNFLLDYPNCSEYNFTVKISGENITDLNGFENLKTIQGALIIRLCPDLINIEGFDHLDSVESVVRIEHNPKLTTINTFGSLNKSYSFELVNNELLEDVATLVDLRDLSEIKIIHNHKLKAINFVDTISLLSSLRVFHNDSLSFFSGKFIFGYGASIQISQTNLMSFENVYLLGENFHEIIISNNSKLEYIGNVLEAKEATRRLWVSNNPKLRRLIELKNIEYVGEQLNITRNHSLLDLQGLNNIVGPLNYNLIIDDNDRLKSLNGLNSLTTTKGYTSISHNDSLISFTGLSSLSKIEGRLTLDYNSTITNFAGLEKIDTIYDNFSMSRNTNIKSLIGLHNLKYIGGTITIRENPLLNMCGIPVFCDLVDGSNPIFIELNKQGCNSLAEIDSTCILLTIDQDGDGFNSFLDCDDNDPNINPDADEIPDNGIDENCDGFDLITSSVDFAINHYLLFPNPVTNRLYADNFELENWTVYDALGNEVFCARIDKKSIDTSRLTPGMYFLRFSINDVILTKSFLKSY